MGILRPSDMGMGEGMGAADRPALLSGVGRCSGDGTCASLSMAVGAGAGTDMLPPMPSGVGVKAGISVGLTKI